MEKNAEIPEERRLTEAGIAYSLSAVAAIVISFLFSAIASAAGEGYREREWFVYLSYLVAQIAMLIAAAVYFSRAKEPLRAPMRPPKWKYFPIAILMQFGLLFSLSFLNDYFIGFLGKLGYHSAGVSVPPLEGWRLLPAILVIALVPAVFEELLFRGILARRMHASGWGIAPAVLLSGALFALFHGRPEQTVYQFLCGCCFSLVALRAGSILPTMAGHFLNNAAILTLGSFGYADFTALPKGALIALCVLSALCLAGTLVYLLFFDKSGNQRGTLKGGKLFFLGAGTGIAVCAVEWIYALVVGFTS